MLGVVAKEERGRNLGMILIIVKVVVRVIKRINIVIIFNKV